MLIPGFDYVSIEIEVASRWFPAGCPTQKFMNLRVASMEPIDFSFFPLKRINVEVVSIETIDIISILGGSKKEMGVETWNYLYRKVVAICIADLES